MLQKGTRTTNKHIKHSAGFLVILTIQISLSIVRVVKSIKFRKAGSVARNAYLILWGNLSENVHLEDRKEMCFNFKVDFKEVMRKIFSVFTSSFSFV
jgi:hypothetical protein